MSRDPAGEAEPTATELAAIDAEWPVTAAELAVLDAEIGVLCAPGEPSWLDWRRLRRARQQLLAVRRASCRSGVAASDVSGSAA